MAGLRVLFIVVSITVVLTIAASLQWLCSPGSLLTQRFTRLSCRIVLGLLQVRVIALNKPPADAPARLLVANHVSWLDVLVLESLEPLCFLAKREVGTWPVIATFARLRGTVFVDRQRRRSLPGANAAMADRLRQGRSVALFPEGTTLDGSRRGRFHTSNLACLRDRLRAEPALATCLVQPAGLRYSDPAVAWVGEATLAGHVWTVAGRGGLTCVVHYGAVLAVERTDDRKVLGRQLALHVEALLAAPAPGDVGWDTGDPHSNAAPVTRACGAPAPLPVS